MELKELEDKLQNLSVQTGMFADFCKFVYISKDCEIDERYSAAAMRIIWHEAARIEEEAEKIYGNVFLKGVV